MARAVTAAAVARPAFQSGPWRVPGPDEDAFTLAVRALELLPLSVVGGSKATPARLHLVGAFGAEADWGFGEVLGRTDLKVHRQAAGSDGVWDALARAVHNESAAVPEIVLAVDLPGLESVATQGAAAAALLLEHRKGLGFLAHQHQPTSSHRLPSVEALLDEWVAATRMAPGNFRGEVILLSEEDPGPVLRNWTERVPGVGISRGRTKPLGLGPAPLLRRLFAIYDLVTKLSIPGMGLIAEFGPRGNSFVGFQLDAAVQWRGSWEDPGPGRPLPPTEPAPSAGPGHPEVSEGAYVPYSRYLENLASRWRLEAHRCARCGKLTFPIRGVCRHCGANDGLDLEALPRDGGIVEAVTTVRAGAQPTEFDPQVERSGAYDVAIVRLADGVRATFQVADEPPANLKVGAKVRTVLRRLYRQEGSFRYGLKALPLEGERDELIPVDRSRSEPASHRPGRRPTSRGRPTRPR